MGNLLRDKTRKVLRSLKGELFFCLVPALKSPPHLIFYKNIYPYST